MTSLDNYLENPEWRRNFIYASTQAPNGGFYKRWPQGGTPGMNSPMNIWATEYSVLELKHGTNDPSPYRGYLQNFTPEASKLNPKVEKCIQKTWNGSNCIGKALYKISENQEKVDLLAARPRYFIPPNGPQD
jgi:hypothetical protein